MQNRKGLITAAFTPFNRDHAVNYSFIPHQIKQLAGAGVNGALVCGSTGEGYSLAIHERKKIVETWRNHIPEDFSLFVHVGHNAIPEARSLALHAHEVGTAGIIVSAPTYFKPKRVEDLVAFCTAIVEGIEDTPVYYYHIPSMSGVHFSMLRFLELASQAIPNFRGIKYTYEDLDELQKCIQFQPQAYEIIFGRDELLFDALQLGVTAAMGSTYNYMAPLFTEMMAAFNKGNLQKAALLQKEANAIIDIIIAYGGGITAGKACMEILGMGCGPLRLPLSDLDQNQMKALQAKLMQTNLMQYVNNQTIER